MYFLSNKISSEHLVFNNFNLTQYSISLNTQYQILNPYLLKSKNYANLNLC
jgi:hypothetical protein